MSQAYATHHPAYLDHHDSFQSTGSDRGPAGAGYGERSTEHFGPADYAGLDQAGLRGRNTYPPGSGEGVKDDDEYNYGGAAGVVTRGSIAAQVSGIGRLGWEGPGRREGSSGDVERVKQGRLGD